LLYFPKKKLGKMERGLGSREAQHTSEEARKKRRLLKGRRGISFKRALTPAERTVGLKRGSRKGEESALGECQLTGRR
jgi:hypothetical protein